jgi:hypothetical protein
MLTNLTEIGNRQRFISGRADFGLCALALTLLLAICLLTPQMAAAKKVRPLALGIDDSLLHSEPTAPLAIERSQGIYARWARVSIGWGQVAPGGTSRPAGFDARNPNDPRYSWERYDATVTRLTAAGFRVYITLLGAPRWAQQGEAPRNEAAGGGAWRPNADDYGDFARAAALRYNGLTPAKAGGGLLPRVRYWQAWNEPNLPLFLAPATPGTYRPLLNSFYDAVKAVQPDAQVIAAGLAPVKSSTPAFFPKVFAQRLLCLKPANGSFRRDARCTPAKFDIFSVHPYSLRAGPRQHAAITGNMFVADVIDIAHMLRAAVRVKSVFPRRPKQLWSTEFAWFTNPPNASVGDPPARAGVRTNIALYDLWRFGVSQITWFATSDSSAAIVTGGGLFDAEGRPKPTRDALRFPFYVQRIARGGLYVWGRAPLGARRVAIVSARGSEGDALLRLTPQADGMFTARIRRPGNLRRLLVRAEQGSISSLAMRPLARPR